MNQLLSEMGTVTILEWIGIAFLVVAELMMSAKRTSEKSWRFWAFAMYMPWDVIFLLSAMKVHSVGWILSQIFFCYMTARGMWNNRSATKKEKR